jgi:ligand-binding SRPBCC domain-containing protein
MRFKLEFRSPLRASRAEVWDWITSVRGISTELRPFMRMSVPRGVRSLKELHFEPGQPLFRSQIYLFGVLPVDYSYLTLLELHEGVGFVEQSPMGSMRLWRHERRIEEAAHGCVLTDTLTFEPRFAASLSRWVVERIFTHRHAVLRRHFGGMAA